MKYHEKVNMENSWKYIDIYDVQFLRCHCLLFWYFIVSALILLGVYLPIKETTGIGCFRFVSHVDD